MITVLGATGFIGSYLVRRLQDQGLEYFAPERGERLGNQPLGHIIYAIGLTSDFRKRPFDTVEAHVTTLSTILREADFESLLYLSSTRLYNGAERAQEDEPLRLRPNVPDDLYNLSKAMGESLALSSGKKARVARLSNVYGADFISNNFLSAIITEAVQQQSITLHTTLDSAKDYVALDQVADLLIAISLGGRHTVYNVASGVNVSNGALVGQIAALTGCAVHVAADASFTYFPAIDVERITDEFGFRPESVLHQLTTLIPLYCARKGRMR
jgi:nucleoside-diphosphate-sugar epimerase